LEKKNDPSRLSESSGFAEWAMGNPMLYSTGYGRILKDFARSISRTRFQVED
jgi:hypothetical protein